MRTVVIAGLILTGCTPAPTVPEPQRVLRQDRFDIVARGGCKATGRFTNTGSVPIEFGQVHLLITMNGETVDSDESLLDVYPLAPGQSSTWETLFSCPPRSGRISYELGITDNGRAVRVVSAEPARSS